MHIYFGLTTFLSWAGMQCLSVQVVPVTMGQLSFPLSNDQCVSQTHWLFPRKKTSWISSEA